MRQNLNTASLAPILRWSREWSIIRVPLLRGPPLIQSYATAACIYLWGRASSHRWEREGPSIIRARGGERAKVGIATGCRRPILASQKTHASPFEDSPAAILESCQQTSHCCLNRLPSPTTQSSSRPRLWFLFPFFFPLPPSSHRSKVDCGRDDIDPSFRDNSFNVVINRKIYRCISRGRVRRECLYSKNPLSSIRCKNPLN